MKKIEIRFRLKDSSNGAKLYEVIKESLENEEIKIISAEEIEEQGLTGTEIIISIIISMGSSIAANLLDGKIKTAISNIKNKTEIKFQEEIDHVDSKENDFDN
jgi:4-hydroxy-3-methylbut-2-enyl diphosphate reductase IspH